MSEGGHRLLIRVYYEDTDFSGVVYHASYLRFLERGRTEMLRAAGIEQSLMTNEEGRPLAFAVRHMTVDFARSARMDDLVEVLSRIEVRGGASLVVAQSIRREGAVLIDATVKIALVSGGRACRIPANLAARLLPQSLP